MRDGLNRHESPALFLSSRSAFGSPGQMSMKWSQRRRSMWACTILHPKGWKITSALHCCRHWHCIWLFRAGMRIEHIKELRGDSRKEAFDLHNHIDLKELKSGYLAYRPSVGYLKLLFPFLHDLWRFLVDKIMMIYI